MKIQQVTFRNCPVCNNNSGIIKNTVNKINLFKCNICSMVFADVEEIVIDKNNIFESIFLELYYRYEPFNTLVYYDMLIHKIQKKFRNKTIRVLDFGSGPGMFMRRARKKGIDIYGSDHSPYAIKAAESFNLKIEYCNIY